MPFLFLLCHIFKIRNLERNCPAFFPSCCHWNPHKPPFYCNTKAMTIEVILDGVKKTATKQQLFALAARGTIGPETIIHVDGKPYKRTNYGQYHLTKTPEKQKECFFKCSINSGNLPTKTVICWKSKWIRTLVGIETFPRLSTILSLLT